MLLGLGLGLGLGSGSGLGLGVPTSHGIGSPEAQIAEANLENITGSVGMGMPCSVQCSR